MNYSNLEKETTKKIDILMLFRQQLSQEGKKNQIRDDLELTRFEGFFENDSILSISGRTKGVII